MTKQVQKRSIWHTHLAVIALLALSLVLAGCGDKAGSEADGEAVVEQLAEAVIAEPAAALEEEAAAAPEAGEMAAEPTVEPVTDECLACHIDKELLIQTADPIEEVVSENEGEG